MNANVYPRARKTGGPIKGAICLGLSRPCRIARRIASVVVGRGPPEPNRMVGADQSGGRLGYVRAAAPGLCLRVARTNRATATFRHAAAR